MLRFLRNSCPVTLCCRLKNPLKTQSIREGPFSEGCLILQGGGIAFGFPIRKPQTPRNLQKWDHICEDGKATAKDGAGHTEDSRTRGDGCSNETVGTGSSPPDSKHISAKARTGWRAVDTTRTRDPTPCQNTTIIAQHFPKKIPRANGQVCHLFCVPSGKKSPQVRRHWEAMWGSFHIVVPQKGKK